MILIRAANESDVEAVCSLDLIARGAKERREFIQSAVVSGACYVAVAEEEVIGYGVLTYTFYSHGNIEMLYVHSGHRRRGGGQALLQHMGSLCRTSKLFTSTNLSNLPMHALLAKLGYVVSGVIHNLDEGDPEVVYFKRLKSEPGLRDTSG